MPSGEEENLCTKKEKTAKSGERSSTSKKSSSCHKCRKGGGARQGQRESRLGTRESPRRPAGKSKSRKFPSKELSTTLIGGSPSKIASRTIHAEQTREAISSILRRERKDACTGLRKEKSNKGGGNHQAIKKDWKRSGRNILQRSRGKAPHWGKRRSLKESCVCGIGTTSSPLLRGKGREEMLGYYPLQGWADGIEGGIEHSL